MMNRLPEKLTALRKHFGYSQGDIAGKLGITVPEYMNWENGNSICSILQLKKIADLYHVPLQDLADNARTVVLPHVDQQFDSVQIPFIGGNDAAPDAGTTPELTEDIADSIPSFSSTQENTSQEKTQEYQPGKAEEETIGQTMEFQPTTVNRIVDDDSPEDEDEEEYEEKEEKPKPKKKKNSSKAKEAEKKRMYLIGGGAAALLVVIILLLRSILGNGSKISVSTSDRNRLALGSNFSMYLRDVGDVTILGSGSPALSTDGLVQVASGSSYALGLKKDGTVVCTGSSSACPADWTGIVDIAAADDHTAGVKKDGTVVCNGSDSACAVDDWKNIKAVYAGNGFTIGRKSDGTLVSAGSYASSGTITSLSNVADLAIGSSQIAVVTNDGRLTTYPVNGGSNKTYDWTGVKKAAVGENFVAAVSGGKLLIDTTDEDMQNAVASWNNLRYIAGRGRTLIAVGKDGTIIGAGDNTSSVYNETAVEPTASASPSASASASATAETLLAPQNIQFAANAAQLTITWDKVADASTYIVAINTTPMTTKKTQQNSVSISADSLTDGTTYTVSVQAVAKSGTQSQPTSVNYTYQATKIQLDTPNPKVSISDDKKSATVSWDKVENAGKYTVSSSNGDTWDVTENSTVIDLTKYATGHYTVTVVAKPADGQTRFTDSGAGTVEFDYTVPAVPLSSSPTIVSIEPVDSSSATFKWNAVTDAKSYTININGSSQETTETTITISGLSDGGVYPYTITANPNDTNANTATSANGSYTFAAKATTPEPSPSAPAETPADPGTNPSNSDQNASTSENGQTG